MEISKWGRFTLATPSWTVLWKRFVQLIYFWRPTTRYETYWLQCGNPNCAADNLVTVTIYSKPTYIQAICPKCGSLNR